MARTTWLRSVYSEVEVDRHSGLYEFNRSALFRDVSCPQLFAKVPPQPLVLAIALFQLLPKIHDHRWGPEQRPIYKLTALWCLKAAVAWPQSEKAHAGFRLFFSNPCINFPFPSSVTREYHPKILELLDPLQCNTPYLQPALPRVSGEA